jgi:hypothetical protein
MTWLTTVRTALHKTSKDATGLSRGGLTFAAMTKANQFLDATGLPRGVSRSLLFSCEREPPRHRAVASKREFLSERVAEIVRLHGTSPWHLRLFVQSQSCRLVRCVEQSWRRKAWLLASRVKLQGQLFLDSARRHQYYSTAPNPSGLIRRLIRKESLSVAPRVLTNSTTGWVLVRRFH